LQSTSIKEYIKLKIMNATEKHGSYLCVKVFNGGYDWIMTREKTVSHLINQIGGIKPEMTERVKAHLEGFKINQLR